MENSEKRGGCLCGDNKTIALMSDFGMADGAAACMEAVIAKINPNARVIHMSHDVPGYDVSAGAMFLEVYYRFYPQGTIFICVVDPDVGTDRKIILVECSGYFFIGADNGMFTRVVEIEVQKNNGSEIFVYEIDNKEYWLPKVSSVFHGRDIMCPVAAHLANGISARVIGREIQSLTSLKSFARRVQNESRTKVLYVDVWGNMVVGVKRDDLPKKMPTKFKVKIGEQETELSIERTFDDVPEGRAAILFGGDFGEYATIVMDMNSAAEKFGAKEGTKVVFHIK